jgi:hypothetical protein
MSNRVRVIITLISTLTEKQLIELVDFLQTNGKTKGFFLE